MRDTNVAGLTWETSPSISQGIQSDPACRQKQTQMTWLACSNSSVESAVLLHYIQHGCVPSLTFLILRLMIDSAANTLSPTADSSMFTPVLSSVSSAVANVSKADLAFFPVPATSEFPTDHNTPEQNGRQRNFFTALLRKPQSVEPLAERPLVQPLLRARVAK